MFPESHVASDLEQKPIKWLRTLVPCVLRQARLISGWTFHRYVPRAVLKPSGPLLTKTSPKTRHLPEWKPPVLFLSMVGA